jgi:hypothetical protein
MPATLGITLHIFHFENVKFEVKDFDLVLGQNIYKGVGNLIFFWRFSGFYQGAIVGVGSPKSVRLAFAKGIFWTRIPKGRIKMHNGNMLANIMTKI